MVSQEQAQDAGEVITVAVDLTAHDPNATVETTVVTRRGTIVVKVDPHTIH